MLLDALWNLLNTVAGFFIVMSIWLGIQTFVRSRTGCAKDRDTLDFMLNGCGGCANSATCSRNKGPGGHHEPLRIRLQ
jgi:hypothetical protein